MTSTNFSFYCLGVEKYLKSIRYTKGYRYHNFLHYNMLSLDKKKSHLPEDFKHTIVTTPKKAAPQGRKASQLGYC